jgi:hypothetical protein
MNNKKLLDKALNQIIKRLEKAESFTLKQAHDIAKEMIKVDLVSYGLVSIVSLLWTLVSSYLLVSKDLSQGERDPLIVFGPMFGVLLFILFLTLFIRIVVAPKLHILEKLKELIR